MRAPGQYVKTIWECLYGMQISPPALMIQLFTRLIISGRFEEIRKLRMEDVEKSETKPEFIYENINELYKYLNKR